MGNGTAFHRFSQTYTHSLSSAELVRIMLQRTLRALGSTVRGAAVSLNEVGSQLQGDYSHAEVLSSHKRITKLDGHKPSLASNVFVAPNASVIGDIHIDSKSSVWYGAVLRGDVNKISIGSNSHIGDNCVIHASSDLSPKGAQPTIVADNVTVEPGAILHGCRLESGCRIGSNAVIMDGVTVESGAYVEAGSVVTSMKTVGAGQVWAGVPAQCVRSMSEEETREMAKFAERTAENASRHAHVHAAGKRAQRAALEEREYFTPEAEIRPSF